MNRGADPYKEERQKEYAGYHRETIRSIPFMVCVYALFFQWIDSYNGFAENIVDVRYPLFLVFVFHILVEVIYKLVDKDNLSKRLANDT